ncbi:MAG: EAL domain-containing protein [Gammaproteobacteria bacterium]|nr:EAL domain-containing protein [Gammaproteobacteria bacterium]NNL45513.1 EAL domain-containing protein [Woeseiaceae bacterium]
MSAEMRSQETRTDVGKAASLLQSLVPRAQLFCFYNLARHCVWSSESADDFEIDNFVAELPEEIIAGLKFNAEILKRTLPSARTVLVLPVYGEERDVIGILVSLFSKNVGKSASFNPKLLKNILEPAVELIGETLRIGQELAASKKRADEVEIELKLVYEVDEKIHGASRRHSQLAQLVGRSGRYLGINYSVLLIPSKRIRISATHASWKNVNRKVLDRYLIDKLLPKLEGQRQPLIFEIPAIEGATNKAEQGYQTLLSPLLDQYGNVEGVFAQLGRVDKKAFSNSDRRFMSHIVRKVEYVIEHSFDAMTGLMNRSGFEAQLHESWNALTSDTDTHQLIYFDLDNLQLVNDTFSRQAGDEVILQFSRMLEEDLPNSAVLSRLAGDEFCILLTHADTDAALQFANEVREKRAALRYLQGDKSLQITMSIGIAEFTHSNGDDGSALTTARMACESAKDHGRDRVEVFDAGNQSIIRRYDDMQLIAEIQKALDGEGFELRAQPIVSLHGTSNDPRYEILLRMVDSDGNAVSTKALFSAAERYHIMPQIDRWVVSNAIAALSDIKDSVGATGAVVSINLSGQSLGDDDIFEFIEEEIRHSGLPPSTLCFEITESAAVSNLAKAQTFIDELKAFGCTISLDDFGAGLSSFAYLKNFNVDILKIDGSFIRDITENRISESMVAAITQVAQVMDLKTVAEYVESDLARQLITKLGVDFAQGHIYGKPVPLESMLSQLTDSKQTSAL